MTQKFQLKTINKRKHFIGIILLMAVCLTIASPILFLNLNWIFYVLTVIVLGFMSMNVLENRISKSIQIVLNEQELKIIDSKNHPIFITPLKEIKNLKIKYSYNNFPSFKVKTLDNKKFKFNSKEKIDADFDNFVNDFIALADKYNIEYQIR